MDLLDYPALATRSVALSLDTDEANARLIITLLLGYPIALLYSCLIYRLPSRVQHLYLLLTGVALFYWNFQFQIVHFAAAIGITYAILRAYGSSAFSVIAVGVISLCYLFAGYYFYLDKVGVISWTTPFCVLVLRLIGLAWDLYDGKKPLVQRSDYQKRAALSHLPSLLETFSFSFTPTAFIAGPQFPMRHYQCFISQDLRPSSIFRHQTLFQSVFHNKKLQRVFTRLFMAVVYLVFFVKVNSYFPLEYMKTHEFVHGTSMVYRLVYMAMLAKISIVKYFIVWLIGEGACVLLGLGCTGRVVVTELRPSSLAGKYNTPDEKRQAAVLSESSGGVFPSECNVTKLIEDMNAGRIKVREAEHTACANVSVVRFELATNTDGLVAGHNINTNKWMLEYVYKRCRFLGNKYLSQLITLLFLAVWHGFHSGYYVNFFLEFITVIVEKDLLSIVKLSKHRKFLYDTWPGVILTTVAGKIHLFFLLGTPLSCFCLLHWNHYYPLLKSTYFVAFIYLLWPAARPLFMMAFPRLRVTTRDEQKGPAEATSSSTSLNASASGADVTSSKKSEEFNFDQMTAVDIATRLRRQSKSALDEAALDDDEEEKGYQENAKILDILPSNDQVAAKKDL